MMGLDKTLDMKKEDYEVYHFRNAIPERGGVTVVYNKKNNRFGVAVCNTSDTFDKQHGIKRALGRSFAQLGIGVKGSRLCYIQQSMESQITQLVQESVDSYNDMTRRKIAKKYAEAKKQIDSKLKGLSIDIHSVTICRM